MLDKKRSELLRFFVIALLLVLTAGVIFVFAVHSPSVPASTVPSLIKGNTNSSINSTITNSAGSATINYVEFAADTALSSVTCPAAPLIPGSWTCSNQGARTILYTITSNGIAASASQAFALNVSAGTTTVNSSITISTAETSGGAGLNATWDTVNVTIDADVPKIFSINASDSNFTLNQTSLSDDANHWLKLDNIVLNFTITDTNFDNDINVSVYYNITNNTNPSVTIPHPNDVGTTTTVLAPTSPDTSNFRYNVTIFSSQLFNGSLVYFTIAANDSVGNINVTNLTTNTFNLSIDGAAPLMDNPLMNDSFDADQDNITTSATVHNFTIIVTDNGGSGVSRVEMAVNLSGTMTYYALESQSANTWNRTTNFQDLGASSGDANYTIWFKAYDNVTNINESQVSINVLVDDADFVASLSSNLTNNFTTSNTTIVNITAVIRANLNHSTDAVNNNVTINGPNDIFYNMTLQSSTAKWGTVGNGSGNTIIYESTWFSSIAPQALNSSNGSWSNLSVYGCGLSGVGDNSGDDGDNCSLRVTWTDIFGRTNYTNITITVDNIGPEIVNITTNATNSSIQVVRKAMTINFSLQAGNNLVNVTVHNSSATGQLTNATLMTVSAVNNYSVTLGVTQVCGVVDGLCTVNFSATDRAGNFTYAYSRSNTTTFYVDDTSPLITNFKVNGSNVGAFAIVTAGKNQTLRSNYFINITFNVTDEITNVTQVNIGNSSIFNATIFGTESASYSSNNTLAGYGCPQSVEGVSCTLVVHAIDNMSIDGSFNVNNSVNITFVMDDLAPRVVNATTDLATTLKTTSATTLINFSVNITDATVFNVTINSTIVLNKSTISDSNSTHIVWWGVATLTTLGCTTTGDCVLQIYANDSAGNINDSVTLTVNLDVSGMSINNRSFGATFKSATPTIHVNTSAPALCRYSTTGVNNYTQMSTQFTTESARHNSFLLGSTLDNDYEYDVSCVDVDGNNVASSTVSFTVDTTSLWNITIGATGSLSAKADYFATAGKTYAFTLPKTNVLATTAQATTYNVTNVLASLVSENPSGANNNLSILYAYNRTGDSWTSFVPGRASNTFTNFTVDTNDYYLNLTVANERIEIS